MSKEYTVFGKVYNVAKDQKESFGESLTDDQEWYEYRVFLQDSNGKIVDEWDSRLETYNGLKSQRLSESKAKEAIGEIKEDINENNEDPSMWFNI